MKIKTIKKIAVYTALLTSAVIFSLIAVAQEAPSPEPQFNTGCDAGVCVHLIATADDSGKIYAHASLGTRLGAVHGNSIFITDHANGCSQTEINTRQNDNVKYCASGQFEWPSETGWKVFTRGPGAYTVKAAATGQRGTAVARVNITVPESAPTPPPPPAPPAVPQISWIAFENNSGGVKTKNITAGEPFDIYVNSEITGYVVWKVDTLINDKKTVHDELRFQNGKLNILGKYTDPDQNGFTLGKHTIYLKAEPSHNWIGPLTLKINPKPTATPPPAPVAPPPPAPTPAPALLEIDYLAIYKGQPTSVQQRQQQTNEIITQGVDNGRILLLARSKTDTSTSWQNASEYRGQFDIIFTGFTPNSVSDQNVTKTNVVLSSDAMAFTDGYTVNVIDLKWPKGGYIFKVRRPNSNVWSNEVTLAIRERAQPPPVSAPPPVSLNSLNLNVFPSTISLSADVNRILSFRITGNIPLKNKQFQSYYCKGIGCALQKSCVPATLNTNIGYRFEDGDKSAILELPVSSLSQFGHDFHAFQVEIDGIKSQAINLNITR